MKKHSAARDLLSCRRTSPADDALPEVRKAERLMESIPALSAGYSRQRELDRRIVQTLDGIPVPIETRQNINAAWRDVLAGRPKSQSILMHPAFLASIFAIVGVVVFFALRLGDGAKSFKGDEVIVELLKSAKNSNSGTVQLIEGKLSEQGDTLFMKGIERFAVPPEYVDWDVKHFKINNLYQNPVAEIAGKRPIIFYVMPESAFNMDLDPNGKWRSVEKNGWIAAVRKIDGVIFAAVCTQQNEADVMKLEFVD